MVGISGRSRVKREEDRRRHKLEEKHKRLDNPPTPFQNGELKFLFPEAIGLFGAKLQPAGKVWKVHEREGEASCCKLYTETEERWRFLPEPNSIFPKERWQGGFD